MDGGEWSISRPSPFTPRELDHRYLLYRKLGEPQIRSGIHGEKKNVSPVGNRTPALQPVYTIWAAPAPVTSYIPIKNVNFPLSNLKIALLQKVLLVLFSGEHGPSTTVAARCEVWNVFARSNNAIVGSNPTQGIDVCVRLFCVCVVLCVSRGLATGWSPVQGVLPTVKDQETEVKRSVSRMPYAPSGSNRNKDRKNMGQSLHL
jgi:hypothetical protein